MADKNDTKAKVEQTTGGAPNNRAGNRTHNRYKGSNRRDGPQIVKFEGKCEQLKGFIYDCLSSRMADMYVKTTNEIADYVGANYKHGGDIRQAILSLEAPNVPQPADPADPNSGTQMYLWQQKCQAWVRRAATYESNTQQAFSLILGQCTQAMKDRLSSLANYQDIERESNALTLLREIKTISFDFQAEKYTHLALIEALKRFYVLNQHPNMTNQQYLEKFKNSLDVIEHCGGQVGGHPGPISEKMIEMGINPNDFNPQQFMAAYETVREEHIATCFLHGSDKQRYGGLLQDYENSYIEGVDRFPKTLTDAYNLLVKYKQNKRYGSVNRISDGANFLNSGDYDDEDSNSFAQRNYDKSKLKCHHCNELGHFENECPKKNNKKDSTNLLMKGDFSSSSFMFCQRTQQNQTEELVDESSDDDTADSEDDHFENNGYTSSQPNTANGIPSSWIILDNGSTVDVFSNGNLLCDVQETNTNMRIHCNAGVSSTKLQGHVRGYGNVWYAPDGIANFLSLYNMTKKFRVTYDSANDDGFVVHKPNGDKQFFKPSDDGLFYLDTAKSTNDANLLINTVSANKNKFTKRDIVRAQAARKLQNIIGRPPLRKFVEIIKQQLLPNCTTTVQDILNAEMMFGPNIGSLKGKTPRSTPPPANIQNIDLPADIIDLYQNVIISGDIMFINKVPFFVTIAHKIKFSTAEALPNRKQKSIFSAVRHVLDIYTKRGFTVTSFMMDGEFECLRQDLHSIGVNLNTTANDEHNPVIERFIRTLKDAVRSIYVMLPFKRIPTIMLTDLVYYSVFWKNAFPHADNIDNRLSPRTIVTGMPIDFSLHCQMEFGTYVQTHEDHDNTMQERTAGAIALRPMGNAQGGWYFMSLNTGRRLRRYQWTSLPMPTDVINRVNKMARRNQAQRDIAFYYRDGLTPVATLANDDYTELAGVNENEHVDDDDNDDSSWDPDEDYDHDSRRHCMEPYERQSYSTRT